MASDRTLDAANSNTNIHLPDLESNGNVPSNMAYFQGSEATSARFLPAVALKDMRIDVNEENDNLDEATNINKLAFKRDPRVAKGPYYTTQVE
jgi:hypothetical protein